MDDRAVSTVQTVLAETRWLPTPCPTEYLPALARDVLYALEKAGMGVEALPEPPKRDACISCGTVLTPVFDDGTPTSQYDNALEIMLSGGYSMFFDNIDGDHHMFLCHDCAHIVCLALPWLNRLIQPEKSHAHTAEFWKYNNGHLGWDKAAAASREEQPTGADAEQICTECSMPEPAEWCWQQSVSCPFGKPPRSKP